MLPARLRLEKDLADLDLPPTCSVHFPDADDLFNFKLIVCPDEGFYQFGRFVFDISVGSNFPHQAPKVKCDNRIFHPNIDVSGNVCLNILREDWNPVLSINSLVIGILFLFMEMNTEDPLNKEAAQLLYQNPDLFRAQVRKAMNGGRIGDQDFDCCLRVNELNRH